MRGGLVTSVLLHAAILGWALFTIQAQRELRVAEPEPIAVDLVNASELTRLRQGARNAKQLEAEAKEAPKPEPVKKEAPKPAPAAAAPPPPPPPPPPPKEEPKKEEPPPKEVAAVPPPPAAPPPVPAPEEQKKLDDLLKEQERQAEEQRKAEEQKQAEEAKKQAELKKKLDDAKKKKEAELKKKREEERKHREAEAKKKQFDAENISALLNKIPDKGGPRPSVPLDEQAKAKGPVLGAPEGRDKQLSASELAVLAQIIKACVQSRWNVQAGGEATVDTLVKLRLRFNPDGTLAGEPVVMNSQNTPMFVVLSEGAKRAAQACQPYSLPPEKYEVWKDIVLNFSLRDMVR
jgi:colicin import membrane protein